MKRLFGFLFLAAALRVACEQQEQPSFNGKAVRFTTSVNTKTSFQGYTQNGVEAILWENGDAFTVWSDQASVAGSSQKFADYVVSAKDGIATAVNPAKQGVELLWGQGVHQFYASYPSGIINGNVIKAEIPDYQVVKETEKNVFIPVLSKYGYMYATAQAKPDDGNVNLVFNPLFNTFEFTVSPGNKEDVQVSGFRLEVQNGSKQTIAGNFLATLSADRKPEVEIDYTNAIGIVKLQFGDHRSIRVEKGTTLTFSVITYPIKMGHLTAVFTVNGKEIALPLADKDGKYYEFAAGQKARIRALGALGPDALAAGITVDLSGQGVTDYDLSTPDPEASLLPGVFTIGDKKVRFSKGNLQAVLENGNITKWQFAEHQWDVAKNAFEYSVDTGIVDGYVISTTAPKNRWGTHYWGLWNVPSELNYDPVTNPDEYLASRRQLADDYHVGTITRQWESPDFLSEYGTGWKILTQEDWFSLLLKYAESTYPPHSGEWKWYTALFTSAKVEGTNGVVLFPDGFQKPDGIEINPITDLLTDASYGAFSFPVALNTYTAQQWSILEEAGAVFVPSSRYFNDNPSVEEISYDPSLIQSDPYEIVRMIGMQEFGMVTFIDEHEFQNTTSAGRVGKIRLIRVVE